MEAVVSGVFGFGWVMCLICGEVRGPTEEEEEEERKEREMVVNL